MSEPADNASLYADHVAALSARYELAAGRFGFDAAVIGAGVLQFRFLDDQAHRFAACPHFLQWAPLLEHPGSAVVFEPGRRPILAVFRPDDYWHQPPALPPDAVAAHFELRVLREAGEMAALLPGDARRSVILGPPEQWEGSLPRAERNPEPLVRYLHYHRARKTAWEVDCVRRAAAIAAPGHRAAERAFRQGAAEYDILAAFLAACRQTEPELPYEAIVALDEHCATLHYQHRDRETEARHVPGSLLIDAGCSHNGYACDITRSYARQDGEFARMIADVDGLQRSLCAAVRPGVSFPDLHRRCHLALAGLLRDWGLVRMAPEEMVAAGVSFTFFPHGLGHLLGLQVHDVGGQMADDSGTPLEPPSDFPKLRFLRALEPGQIVTIEPGVYFIDSLLERLQAGPHAQHVDWTAIGRLRRYGGIRIEDDVLVTAEGSENLTRPLL